MLHTCVRSEDNGVAADFLLLPCFLGTVSLAISGASIQRSLPSLSPILLEKCWSRIVDAGTASDFSMWCLEMDLASELPSKCF